MSSTRAIFAMFSVGILFVLGMDSNGHSQPPQEAAPPPRTWTSQTGKAHIEGSFIEFKDGKVSIRQNDGQIVSTAIENLCDADWEYVRQRVRKMQGHTTQESAVVLQEDFAKFEKGDLPDWGEHVHVEPGLDGRKWLAPSDGGIHHVGRKVAFPPDWFLQFDFTAHSRKEGGYNKLKGYVTSAISLIDQEGRPYRIGWQVSPRIHAFVFPDGATEEFGALSGPAHGAKKDNADYWFTGKTLRIENRNEVLTIYLNGKAACTKNVSGMGTPVRFTVDASLRDFAYGLDGGKWEGIESTTTEWICFTNFKAGGLGAEMPHR